MSNATAIRLPEALKRDANAYATSLGISVNALMAVALRDYLDARSDAPSAGLVTSTTSVVPEPQALPAPGAVTSRRGGVLSKSSKQAKGYSKPAGGVNAPCPCGSGQKYKKCHGSSGASGE